MKDFEPKTIPEYESQLKLLLNKLSKLQEESRNIIITKGETKIINFVKSTKKYFNDFNYPGRWEEIYYEDKLSLGVKVEKDEVSFFIRNLKTNKMSGLLKITKSFTSLKNTINYDEHECYEASNECKISRIETLRVAITSLKTIEECIDSDYNQFIIDKYKDTIKEINAINKKMEEIK